jgi:hypothetical protein
MIVRFGIQEIIQGSMFAGLSTIIFFAVIFPFTLFALKKLLKSNKRGYEEENTQFVIWSNRMNFDRWSVNHSDNKEVNGYYRLTFRTLQYANIGDFSNDIIECKRYFNTAVQKDNNMFVKGIDIEKIDIINEIKDLTNYIENARRNYKELTNLRLERHNEIFILLYSTNKHPIELSLENLQKVKELITIVKEDLEGVIVLNEQIFSQIKMDENELIAKKLDDEIRISKHLENKRNELTSQINHFN